MKKVLFFNYFFTLTLVLPLISQEKKTYSFPPPTYVSLINDLNMYYMYANGGFHADWYVGYNNAWIVKLPPIDTSGYVKAFIGAKLGRAKNVSYPSATDLEPFKSKIFTSISNSPKFPQKVYVLCESSDIPLEPLEEESIRWVDSSKWFWTEVPLKVISSQKDNYVAVWAESPNLNSSQTSPIIAAGYLDDGKENVWVNTSIKGSLSMLENSLETPISGMKPAIVIKLIKENDYRVVIKNFSYDKNSDLHSFSWNVIAADAEKSWLEISFDKIKWDKFSRYIFYPPYSISFKNTEIPQDVFYIRACATDIFENTECSSYVSVNNTNRRQ
ncbi:MAG: hypothetical protein ACP5IO_03830 [Elusimicrobiales bacterium]